MFARGTVSSLLILLQFFSSFICLQVFLFIGQIAKLTPPWLLNLAKRHNQWKGTLKVGLGRTFFQPLIQILNQWVWLECVFTQIRTGYFLFGNVLKLK